MSFGDILKGVGTAVGSTLGGPAGGLLVGGLLGGLGANNSGGPITTNQNSTTDSSRATNTTGSVTGNVTGTSNASSTGTSNTNTTGNVTGTSTGTGTTTSIGTNAGTQTTTLTQQQQIGQLLNMLNGISGINPASLVPGFNATQTQGQNAIVNAAANTPNPNAALATVLDPNLLKAETNPYLTGAMDAATTSVFNQLQKNVLPALRNDAVAAGQVGGSRQGVLENRAVQDATAEALRQTLGLSNQNYQTGLGTLLSAITASPSALNTNLTAGNAILDVGNQMQGQQAAEAAAPITLAQAFQQLLAGNYGSTVATTGTAQQTGTTAQTQQTQQASQQQSQTQESQQSQQQTQQQSQQQTQQNTNETGTSTTTGNTTQKGPSGNFLTGAIGGAVAGAALQAELFPNSMGGGNKTTTTAAQPNTDGGQYYNPRQGKET